MEQLFLNFKKRIEEHPNLVEAICLSNKDGLIWKEQYLPRTVRNIYSHSKSFTSLMVGIAIDEEKLSLDTRLVDVFKEEINEETYNRLYEITVKDLLSMSSGFDEDYLFGWQKAQGIGYPDYLKFMLSRELKQKPGTKFHYSNGDTYLVSRMIEKVYNKKFVQLCYEKIFQDFGLYVAAWFYYFANSKIFVVFYYKICYGYCDYWQRDSRTRYYCCTFFYYIAYRFLFADFLQ